MWDFISAENSTGFHNPEYALKVLAESTNLARQAQMLAAQSVNDMSLLTTGTYYQTSGVSRPHREKEESRRTPSAWTASFC